MILIISILMIIITITVGLLGVLDFNKCKDAGGVWNYEKKICEHTISKASP